MNQDRFIILDHTADVAIKAFGDTLEDLFANSAAGMFSLIAEIDDVEPEQESEISLEAMDLETLLVAWLSELQLRFEMHREYFLGFHVEFTGPNSLKAKVCSLRLKPDRHEILHHIKAVTYHGLHVEQRDSGWQTMIVFDT